jgi:hypothetical protein
MKKSHDAHLRTELQKLPNVGPRTADDLIRLGVKRVSDLARMNPDKMYEKICRLDGQRHDPCVWDVFAAVVDHAKGGPPRRWWEYSAIRKARDAKAAPKGRRGAR